VRFKGNDKPSQPEDSVTKALSLPVLPDTQPKETLSPEEAEKKRWADAAKNIEEIQKRVDLFREPPSLGPKTKTFGDHAAEYIKIGLFAATWIAFLSLFPGGQVLLPMAPMVGLAAMGFKFITSIFA